MINLKLNRNLAIHNFLGLTFPAFFGGFCFYRYIYTMILTAKIILIAWFISKFEPIRWLVESFEFKNKLIQFAWEHIQCPKCLGFWIGLFCTFDLFNAILISVCTSILNKLT